MKEDVEIPARPPRKRRQLEAALDVWLATWLARDDLTPSERRRVEAEKTRRRGRVLPVILGFTGTREGLTPPQRRALREQLAELEPLIVAGVVEGHHGDCVGGDEQFHSLCREFKIPIVIHPPTDSSRRAFCEGAIRVEKAKEFLERNKDIVRESTRLVACPKEGREPPPGRGQGTWSTIRYARKRSADRRVIMPTGEELEEAA